MENSSTVAALCPKAKYQESRAQLFPSTGSFDWFVRENRATLVAAGALVMLKGQWLVHPDRCDAAVLEIGRRAAQKAVSS